MASARKAFARFATALGDAAKFVKPDTQADLNAHKHNETTIMLFTLWLSKQKSQRGPGLLSQSTTDTYVDLVARYVQHTLGCSITHRPVRLKRLAKLMHSRTTSVRRKRMGLRCAHLRELWHKHKKVRSNTHAACTAWAMVTVAWSLIARGSEIINIQVQDISFHRLSSGTKYVMIMLAPLKKPQSIKIPQVIKYIPAEGEWQPYLALKRLMNLSKTSELQTATNAFKLPAARGALKVVKVDQFRQIVRRLAELLQQPTAQFGAHSCRIGGATDLFSDSRNKDIEIILQNRGRWASDVYRIYVRITRRAHLHASHSMFAAGGRSMEELLPSFAQPGR